MIADHSQDLLDTLQELLELYGYFTYRWLLPASLEDFIRYAHSVAPKVVVWDIIFPYDAELRKFKTLLRGTSEARWSWVLTSTGSLQVEGFSVLHKPFDIDELLGVIKQAMAVSIWNH